MVERDISDAGRPAEPLERGRDATSRRPPLRLARRRPGFIEGIVARRLIGGRPSLAQRLVARQRDRRRTRALAAGLRARAVTARQHGAGPLNDVALLEAAEAASLALAHRACRASDLAPFLARQQQQIKALSPQNQLGAPADDDAETGRS